MASFRKIRYNKGQVTLTRIDDRSVTDSIEQTLTSSESPRPEFGKALHALTDWVLEICDLPAAFRHGLSITGCTMTLGVAGGIVVTAQKKVSGSNAPMMIHTPHVPEEPMTKDGPALPDSVREVVTRLEREAQRFWDGDRAQAGLFQDAQPYRDGPADDEDGPDAKTYTCKCGFVFDASLGKYGCPNCAGHEGAAVPPPKLKDKTKGKKSGQWALVAGKTKDSTP